MSEAAGGPSYGRLLWSPSPERVRASRLAGFSRWLAAERGLDLPGYEALWRWSVDDLPAFWGAVCDHLGVRFHERPRAILGRRAMPGAEWLPGATLNYAEHALARRDGGLAVLARREDGAERRLTRRELAREVACTQAGLRAAGVRRGDRVVAFAPNSAETLVAFLAVAGLGATWSSCSPEFGVGSVLDRFAQVEPVLLLAAGSSCYGGRVHDRRAVLAEIRRGLPTVRTVVQLPGPRDEALPGAVAWEAFQGDLTQPAFEPVPADHPLWILYSSGTTGLPKAIVQGHGGILLEHLKALALHGDLGEGDRFFWYTTTGWMMWNFLVSGLLVGATVLLWDGSPMHPDPASLWRFAAETGMTTFGTSAPYLLACRKQGLVPREVADLSALTSIGSTGAPLPPEGFDWVYRAVKEDVQLASISGGTDACTAFVLGCPTLPVRSGEIQCLGLGCKVLAFDESGRPVVGQVGELVLTEPLPSMPTMLWNDPDGSRLRESYFEPWPGVWRHGDWITINERGSCVITGRSDSTLNRGGVRMGTSELYRVVEALPGVKDSVVVDTGTADREGEIWLFVVPAEAGLSDELVHRIKAALRTELSPRHVPDRILAVAEVPRTISGKKLEVPIKRILGGADPATAASRDSLANPAALDAFVELARQGG